MNILTFLFYLGIINIVFNFLWKWVFVLPSSVLLALLNLDLGMRFVKIFGVYLMVSLMALLTLGALGESPNLFATIFYPLITVLVLFIGLASAQHEARKQAYQDHNLDMLRRLEEDSGFEVLLSIGSVLLFILVLFVPEISSNPLITFLFEAINWIYNIPIIGLLIGVGGILFIISTIFHGIGFFGVIVAGMLGFFKENKVVAEATSSDAEPKLE